MNGTDYPPHIPQPSDICSVCGNGLVHIDPAHDRPPVTREQLARALAGVLEGWGVDDMIRDHMPELVDDLVTAAIEGTDAGEGSGG